MELSRDIFFIKWYNEWQRRLIDDMAMVLYERVGLNGRRISPFSWRVRYALAHKNLAPLVVPTRFVDIDRIRAVSNQDLVPVLEDGGRVIPDSWAIACYLNDNHPEGRPLFDGEAAREAARAINGWCDTELMPSLRRLFSVDFIACVDPADRAYYRASREATFGAPLEVIAADGDRFHQTFLNRLTLLIDLLSRQSFLSGTENGYADYVVLSLFKYARIARQRDVLPPEAKFEGLRRWRDRMFLLFEHLEESIDDDRVVIAARAQDAP
jgi:glutathione S-transferase